MFKVSSLAARGSLLALATVTVTARAIALYTHVRCPKCQGLVMAIPGNVPFRVLLAGSNEERQGLGRVVSCRRKGCGHLCEIVEAA